MTTQLSLYNQALFLLKERDLSSLASGSSREASQKFLDVIWDAGAVDYCLSQAYWNFATRTVQISFDPDVTPSFGLKYAFNKPSDWIKTAAVCIDEYFRVPTLEYEDKNDRWFSDNQNLYIKYISNDSSYGGDLSLYPEAYEKFVAAYLAKETASRITGDGDFDSINAKYLLRYGEAKRYDANNQPTKMPASGNWVTSRTRGRNSWTDR